MAGGGAGARAWSLALLMEAAEARGRGRGGAAGRAEGAGPCSLQLWQGAGSVRRGASEVMPGSRLSLCSRNLASSQLAGPTGGMGLHFP